MEIKTSSSTSVNVAKKQNCIGCGKELGVMKQHQLADMTALCGDCLKKASPYMDAKLIVADEYKAHLKQLQDGQKLYDAYFNKNRKVKKVIKDKVHYDPVTALVCIIGKRGGFGPFGGEKFYCVMRVADLDQYEKATKFTKGLENRNIANDRLFMTFRRTSGLSCFMIPAAAGEIHAVEKQFNEVFNGKGFFSRAKADFKKGQAEAMAGAGIGLGLKAVLGSDGFKNGKPDEAMMEGAAQIEANMEAVFYAGREELMKKADDAIKAVLG